MKIGNITPILRSFDEAKAREFYIGFLGFKLDFEHRFEPGLPLYMQVSRSDCILHLSEHHGDASPGSAMRIAVDDIDTFHQQLTAANYKYAKPGIESTPWDTREVTVKDPFGHRLVFTAAIST